MILDQLRNYLLKGFTPLRISEDIRTATPPSYRRFLGTEIDYEKEVGDLTNSSLVMAAVNWVSTTLPEAPLEVVGPTPDGLVSVPDHGLLNLLERPNNFFTAEVLWAAFSLSWMVDGNVYWLKVRNDSTKNIRELWPLPHYLMEPRWRSETSFIDYYEYTVGKVKYEIAPEDIVHFRFGIDPHNQRKGVSRFKAALREIYSDEQAANYSALLGKNLGVFPYIVSPKSDGVSISAPQAQQLSDSFQRATTGDNRHRALVSSIPMGIERIQYNPSEMDVKTLRRLPEERVAASASIPAIVLGFGAGLDRSTFANYKEAREAAYESFIIPTQRVIASQIRHSLLNEFDKSGKQRIRFDLSQVRVLQEDRSEMFRRNSAAVQGQWMKISEARAEAGLVVSPEDDRYLENFAPMEFRREPIKSAQRVRFKQIDDDDLSDEEIEKAEAVWRNDAPSGLRYLLAATGLLVAGHFTWNAAKRRFEDSKGRVVSRRELQRAFEQVLTVARSRITRRVSLGTVSAVDQFVTNLSANIRTTQTIANALANGGIQNVDKATVWTAIHNQNKYLSNWSGEMKAAIASGENLSAASVNARAEMYIDSAYPEFQRELVERERKAGVERVKRVLDPEADHCDGCVESEGEWDIDQVPEIGEQECGSRCRCEIVPIVEEGEA